MGSGAVSRSLRKTSSVGSSGVGFTAQVHREGFTRTKGRDVVTKGSSFDLIGPTTHEVRVNS